MTGDFGDFQEEDESLAQIKAAWNHAAAHNFDTPEKAEAHACDPNDLACLAYLWHTGQLAVTTWSFRCQHARVSGNVRHPICAACGSMRRVAA